MARKITAACLACGAAGHAAKITPALPGLPQGDYMCPMRGAHPWGVVAPRAADGRCSRCGASGFRYSNGMEIARDGTRGYRCMTCGAVKPER